MHRLNWLSALSTTEEVPGQ